MIIDANLLLSSAQALTTTADSTNIIDLLNARDMGLGGGMSDICLICSVGTALSGGTSINFQLMGSVDNSTYTVYAESGAVLTASLTANAEVLRITIPARPANAAGNPRYYKMTYTIVGTYSAGTVYAYFTLDRQGALAYAPGVTQFL